MRTTRNSLLAATALCLCAAAAPYATLADETAANAWIATARDAAQSNEHSQSIKGFENAISEEPSKRPEILREYADQLTYGGRVPMRR